MMATTAATTKEIMATALARDLEDGEWVEVGANLPVPRAGVLLAHLMWGANMTVMIAMTKANVLNEPVIEEFELITDHRATRWAEAYYLHNDLVENMKFRRKGVFFAGALQIDRYGNSNLVVDGYYTTSPSRVSSGDVGVSWRRKTKGAPPSRCLTSQWARAESR
jgi:glutaconate CoA-transferase subunit B